MKMQRIWAMPHRWTFNVAPIANLLKRYDVGQGWADPFAGQSLLAEFRNDLNPENNQPSCVEAQVFLAALTESLNGAIFDPPYSLTQVSRSYNDMGIKGWNADNKTGGFPKVRDEIARLVKQDGHVISFGWNSTGMGKNRGFEIVEILLVAHGGNRNDTIVTVERKL